MNLYKNTQIEEINQAINNVKGESFIVQVSCKYYGNYEVKVYYDKTDNTINVRTISVEGEKSDWYSPTTYRFDESGLDRAFSHLTLQLH